jgi:hypothetical protein
MCEIQFKTDDDLAIGWCPSLYKFFRKINEEAAFLLLAVGNELGDITIWKLSWKSSSQKSSYIIKSSLLIREKRVRKVRFLLIQGTLFSMKRSII